MPAPPGSPPLVPHRAPAASRPAQPRPDSLLGQRPRVPGQGPERIKPPLSVGGGGIQLLGRRAKAGPGCFQPDDDLDQVGQGSSPPVLFQIPCTSPGLEQRQQLSQARPVIAGAAGLVLEPMALVHCCRLQRIVLWVGGLPVGVGRHPQRADYPVRKCPDGISGPFGYPLGFFVLPTGLKSGLFILVAG